MNAPHRLEEKLKDKSSIVRSLIECATEFLVKACGELVKGHDHHFCLNAAVSIELFGKAVLSEISPALIAVNSIESLLILLEQEHFLQGRNVKLRTISAREVIDRYAKVQPKLGPLLKQLEILLEIRDGTLHFDASTKAEISELASSYLSFLRVTAVILKLELVDLFGEEDFVLLFEDHADKSKSLAEKAVARKVLAAKRRFSERFERISKSELEKLHPISKRIHIGYADVDLVEKCPACGMKGELGCSEEISDDIIFDGENPPTARATWYPIYFVCGFCQLELEGESELEVFGLDSPYETEVEAEDILFNTPYYPDEWNETR